MDTWKAMLGNQVLVSAVVGWTVAQVLKTLIDFALNKSFNAERLVGSGGMPSSHSATVCGLTTAAGLKYGAGSFEFAISFILSMVVMYDAVGVRQETGKQARLLNSILLENPLKLSGEVLQQKLKEYVGHTPIQVFAGAVLGIILALVINNFPLEEPMSIFNYVNWFFMYSFLGYLLECIVLTIEYKKPVVDRGFGHGPFCIIYGFGAVGACLLLSPLSDHPVELYTASMTMATTMELITANVMIRLFGSFWWDYSHKPFNYRGIICLESSLAWGLLGLFFFYYLDGWVRTAVGYIPGRISAVMAVALTLFYLCDFFGASVCVLVCRKAEKMKNAKRQ